MSQEEKCSFLLIKAESFFGMTMYSDVLNICNSAIEFETINPDIFVLRAKVLAIRENDYFNACLDLMTALYLEEMKSDSIFALKEEYLEKHCDSKVKEYLKTNDFASHSNKKIKKFLESFSKEPIRLSYQRIQSKGQGEEAHNGNEVEPALTQQQENIVEIYSLLERREFSEAVLKCTSCLMDAKCDDDDEKACLHQIKLLRASLYCVSGKPNLARKDFDDLIHDSTDQNILSNVHIKYAFISFYGGEEEKALNFLQKAEDYDPSSPDAYYYKALLLSMLNDIDSFDYVQFLFEKSIELDITNSKKIFLAQIQRAYLKFKHLLSSSKNFSTDNPSQLLKELHDLTQKYPECVETYVFYAQALDKLNLFEKAVGQFEKALAIDAKDADIYAHLALTLDKWKCEERAISVLKRGIQEDGCNASFCYEVLGTLLIDSSFDEALDCFKKAIKLSTNIIELNSLFYLHEETLLQRKTEERFNKNRNVN